MGESMKKDVVFYGIEGWERLESSAEEVVERMLDESCERVGEDFDAIADRLNWPIPIRVFKRMDIEGMATCIGETALERALEDLDEQYSDPSGDYSTPTEAMKKAAQTFGRAVIADYVPWACQPTGEVIQYTREEARENFAEDMRSEVNDDAPAER